MADLSVFQRIKSKEDFDRERADFEMKKQLAQAEINKQSYLDVDKLGEVAFMKAAMGAPLTPQEEAAARFIDAKSGGISFNPATGEVFQRPRISEKIGLPGYAPSQQQQSIPTNGGAHIAPMQGMTPKGRQTFTDTQIKEDRDRLNKVISSSESAELAKGAAQRMQSLQKNLGYTGIGATPIAFTDKLLTGLGIPDVISGTPEARENFAKESVNTWVQSVEPLKGALTEMEGARFDRAVPSLTMTPAGISLMNKATILMSDRAKEKSNFYQDWYYNSGSLIGADRAWQQYSNSNPIFPEGFWGPDDKAKSETNIPPITDEELNARQPKTGGSLPPAAGMTPPEMASPADKMSIEETVFNAKKAIKAGKSKDAIRQRLIEAGINPARAGL